MNPYELKKSLVTLIRNLYSSPYNFIYSDASVLAELNYKDDNTSDLFVYGDYTFNPGDTANAPAVYISCQDSQISSSVMSDNSYYKREAMESSTKAFKFVTPVIVSHIMRNYDDAYLMAVNTSVFFSAYSEEMQRVMLIDSLKVNGISSPKLASGQSADRRFIASVSLVFTYYSVVEVTPEQNILKKVALSTLSS